MSNTSKIIIAIVVVVIIAGGAWLLMSTKDNNVDTPDTQQNTSQTDQPTDQEEAEIAATITYSAAGFSPSDLTVKSGQAVKIVNETNQVIKFASDPHPSHTNNPELNSGDIIPGGSAVVTLTEKGEWGFHNHFDPTMQGTIKVE